MEMLTTVLDMVVGILNMVLGMVGYEITGSFDASGLLDSASGLLGGILG